MNNCEPERTRLSVKRGRAGPARSRGFLRYRTRPISMADAEESTKGERSTWERGREDEGGGGGEANWYLKICAPTDGVSMSCAFSASHKYDKSLLRDIRVYKQSKPLASTYCAQYPSLPRWIVLFIFILYFFIYTSCNNVYAIGELLATALNGPAARQLRTKTARPSSSAPSAPPHKTAIIKNKK